MSEELIKCDACEEYFPRSEIVESGRTEPMYCRDCAKAVRETEETFKEISDWLNRNK